MATPSFDLVDVTQTLRNRRRFIIIITVVAAVLGAALYLVKKKRYKAKADFIMANPLYADRNNLFRANEMRFVDYFGGDDDVDRILIVAESDTVRNMVAQKLNLAEAYRLDMTKAEDRDRMKGTFKKFYNIDRTEYKTCEVYYTDTDPKRAAAVVNESITVMEQVFRGYYIGMRQKIHSAISAKVTGMDSTIVALTDTLAIIRDKHQLYDIISPARENLVTSTVKGSGGAGFGKAVEQIQNIEAIKDKLVVDRANYISLLNEFSTNNNANDLPLITVITPATAPVDPSGPGILLTVLACAFIGAFFSAVYILISSYYKMLITVQR